MTSKKRKNSLVHLQHEKPSTSQQRTYRHLVHGHLLFTRVTVQETDLGIYADADVAAHAKELVIEQRGFLEHYIRGHESFLKSMAPLHLDELAPAIVRRMLRAGKDAGVGPMAAVAGAMAEQVGTGLQAHTGEVIVENGGDVYIHSKHELTVGVYAGTSPLSMKVGLKVEPSPSPRAVCTSSGTIGHSLSLGKADAVCVVSQSCPLADAAATAIGNRIRNAADIQAAIEWGKHIGGVDGIFVIVGDKMGMWGDVTLTPLNP